MNQRKPLLKKKTPHKLDEKTFQRVFGGHSASMLLIEPDTGLIFDANQAAVDFYGYPREKLCGMPIAEINMLPPEQVAAERSKALSEQKNYFVFSHRLSNGEVRVVEVHSSPITLQDGQFLVSIIHDITERRRAEEALRRRTDVLTSLQATILDISTPHSLSELLNLIVERAATILDASSGGLYLVDPEQRKVRCLVSYKTKEDFTGTQLDFGVGAAGYVAETGKPLIIDDYRKWRGRAAVYEDKQPFQAVMSAPMLWQGNVSGVIHLLRDDVSKKFTTEELDLLVLFANHAAVAVENSRLFGLLNLELNERKHAEDLLEQTRRNYEAFFNSIDEFLFVLDEKGNILHTNKTVTDRLKYTKEQLLGQSVLTVHPPERRDEAGRIVGEMLAGTADFCPVPLMTKQGERIPVETRVVPGFWNGNPAIFGVTKDMSQVELSEEKFSKAFQSNSALMALSRFEDGTYIDVNNVFLETLGFSREEVIGKTSRELHIFDDAGDREKFIGKLKQGQTVENIDVKVRTKRGLLRDGLFSADTIYVGKDLCLLTVMVDITDRKRVEEALRESQSLYHSLVEVSPLSICRKDLEGRFTFANRRFLELSNIELDDLVGKTDFDLHPSELAEKYRRDDQAIIESGRVQELIEERAMHDGGTVIVQSIKTPIYDGTGKVNGIQISFWDVTERKQMEQALRESEEKFRAVIDQSVEGITLVDEQGMILEWNHRQEQFSGVTRSQALGRPIWELMPMVAGSEMLGLNLLSDASARLQNMFQIKEGLPTSGVNQVTYILPDGTVRYIEHHYFPVNAGARVFLVNTAHDVTLRKQAEENLHQQNEYFSILYNIMLDLLNHRSINELFQVIVDQTARLLEADFVELMLERDGELVVQTFTHNQPLLKGDLVSRESARLSWQAFDTKQPVILKDYSSYPYRQDIYSEHKIHAVADFPVMIGEKCIGILSLGRSKPGYIFNETQTKNGMLFVQLIALVLDNVQLFSNLETEISERKQVESELQDQRDFATQIINTMGQGLTVTDAEGRFVFVNPAYARLFGYEATDLIGKHPADVTIPEERARLDQQRSLRQAGKTSTYESRLILPDGSSASVLITGVPRERDGKYAGAIAVITDLTGQKRVEDELRRAKQELELTNQKLEQALARETQRAQTDALTGVNSRGFLFELAARKFNTAMRYKLPLSVILFDVDHFKLINDTFGHATGDLALQRITQVVCDQIRSADVIGRYGGDEFVILLPQSNAQEAARLAERIHSNVAEIRIETENGKLSFTISLGIAQLFLENGKKSLSDTLENLLMRADQALYAAKQSGRNRSVIFGE